ncbi:YtxH domain-containing protein [Agromyces agglutinans]|uniref:YtxH domain-containing protein n=1 Tax=Agromyces agglutinans TaxID=2662258 RepID=UPI001C12A8A3|nr:YtxH domain-containing protein [Agromyces agglutinans]
MKGKILFVVGLGVGYVLGTRAGRERYEQIKRGAERLWNQPAVQQGVETVTDFAKTRVGDVGEVVLDKAKELIGSATRGSGATKSDVSKAAASARQGVSKSAKAAKSAVDAAADALDDVIEETADTASRAAKPAPKRAAPASKPATGS